MYRLLIVDDLPLIVEGLQELFFKAEHLDLEVYKAYSGFEALETLQNYRIDIVLSDIRMPGMQGIELLKEIRCQWPNCKVIFLTSYNDFTYVQHAISLGGFEYILKTEGDDKILLSVEKAIASLDEEHNARNLIDKAEKHMKLALPALQKDYLWALLQRKKVDAELLPDHFANIQLPLRADRPVLLLIGRVDAWKEITSAPDKALLIYAVQNIVEEYLSVSVQMIDLVYEQSKILWFIQPNALEDIVETDRADAMGWDQTFHFVNGTLETIQDACRQLLKLTVSFVLSSTPIQWDELPERFNSLKFLLIKGLGQRSEILMTDETNRNKGHFQSIRTNLLSNCLESGHAEEFYKLYDEISDIFLKESFTYFQKVELYHSLSTIFLAYLNKHGQQINPNPELEWSLLTGLKDTTSWQEVQEFFFRLAYFIFETNKTEQEESSHEIVRKVHEYIESNISDDISLIKLAEYVHFNPSYLSRLYKQITGNGLSDYITEFRNMKAKELLKDSHLKVQEIAMELGYNSALAFIRFFKKQNQMMTPQEYRSSRRADI
ncbi:response regulator transcription factor [Paenibacillus eucommiae]|uniref:Two-component system response regulator YesN n=1 Tax=Paenibacillus eucommiae TaxID=1355755 RepID=A0ABS4IM62_9BACL|nr:response regulator [Paenibacillus eucommiae]MBP1988652.1 two-component system response regulator YesN [Paenibacillus eucommiae]